MDVAPCPWTRETVGLWRRISAHAFDDSSVTLDFTRRLARTLAWSIETSRAGLEEYKRFCFLAIVNTGAPVTPSEEIDEIWHLHLVYTRDYWDRWCGIALGRPLHHDPTCGGPIEQRRYRAQYAETLALYESYFGPPPAAFWPGTAKRFAAMPRYRLIDRDRMIVFQRPARLSALVAFFTLLITPASAQTGNPLDLSGSDFLQLFFCLSVIVVLASALLRVVGRTTGRPTDLTGLSPVAAAYAIGGMTRAADTLFLVLAEKGVASHADERITIASKPGPLEAEINRFHAAVHGAQSRKAMIADFKRSAAAHAMRDEMERRNLILAPIRRFWLAMATSIPAILLLALGLAKIGVGLSRERPVGFLILFCCIVGIALVLALIRERYLTKEGIDALRVLRTRYDRAIRAPRAEDIPLAFALGGAAVLAGTEHAAYARTIQLTSAGGDSGSGCSGGSDGGGGGGCGGCSS